MHKYSTLQWAIISISKQDGRKLFNLYIGVIVEKIVSSGAGILLRVVQSLEDLCRVRLSLINPIIGREQEENPPHPS